MTGNSNGDEQNIGNMSVILIDEEINNLSRNDEEKCLLVEERNMSQYGCPIFILSVKEEKRVIKPRKSGFIIKILGRRLDTRP